MSRYEEIISRHSGLSRDMHNVLSGAARATRLAEEPPDEHARVVTAVAAGMFSPLAVLFVWWVLAEARRQGVKRLYFMARDGFVFKQIADILVEAWKLEIDVRYLYCSRESLLLPSFIRTGDFELHWLTWGYLSSITPCEVFSRLRVVPEDIRTVLGDHAPPDIFDKLNAALTPQGGATLSAILRDSRVEELVREKNYDFYTATVGYLRQEGLLANVPFAVVDTGWRGTSQYALSAILNRAGVYPPNGVQGYYLGLNQGTAIFENDRLNAFMFDWNNSMRDYRLYNFICLEMLFSSGHGRTTGYRVAGDTYEPILAERCTAEREFDWVVQILQRCAKRYATLVSKVFELKEFESASAELTRSLARTFISSPTANEAAVFGDYKIASEIRERDLQSIAPPLNYANLFAMARGRDRIRGFWPQGSMARSKMRVAGLAYRFFLDLRLLELYRRIFLRY